MGAQESQGPGRQARARVPCFRILYLFASDPRGFLHTRRCHRRRAPPRRHADACNPSARTPPPEPASPCVPTPSRAASVRLARRAGPTEARDAVLLVHGSSSTSFGFRALIDDRRAKVHAIAVDSPGSDSAPRAFPTTPPRVRPTRRRGGRSPPPERATPRTTSSSPKTPRASASRTPSSLERRARRLRGRLGSQRDVLEPIRERRRTVRDPTRADAARLADAYAASPAFPAAIARGCAPDMRPEDAASHAWLLRADGALHALASAAMARPKVQPNPSSVSRATCPDASTRRWCGRRTTHPGGVRAGGGDGAVWRIAADARYRRNDRAVVRGTAGAPKETAEAIDAIVTVRAGKRITGLERRRTRRWGTRATRERTRTRTRTTPPRTREDVSPNAAEIAAMSAGASSARPRRRITGQPDREEL